MTIANDSLSSNDIFCASVDEAESGYDPLNDDDFNTLGAFEPDCPALDNLELMAAYLAGEPDVSAMLQLVIEMNNEQRRLCLAMMQCVSAGEFAQAMRA